MEDFKCEQGDKTPAIYSDPREGIISITGKSLPEDAEKFYSPFTNWLEHYVMHRDTVIFNMQLHYFNTSSAKFFLDMFNKLKFDPSVKNLKVFWSYEVDDIDMFETGEAYKKLLGDVVELIPVEEA